jgi:acyl-CoA synthetase (NDP forming)
MNNDTGGIATTIEIDPVVLAESLHKAATELEQVRDDLLAGVVAVPASADLAVVSKSPVGRVALVVGFLDGMADELIEQGAKVNAARADQMAN